MVTASRPSASASAMAPTTMVSRLSRSRATDPLLLFAMSPLYPVQVHMYGVYVPSRTAMARLLTITLLPDNDEGADVCNSTSARRRWWTSRAGEEDHGRHHGHAH